MMPLRRLIEAEGALEVDRGLDTISSKACGEAGESKLVVAREDIFVALSRVNGSVSADAQERCIAWETEFAAS